MAKSVDKIGRVTSASVEKGTGKSWDQWLKILNTAGAKAWTHQEIALWLKKKHKLSVWWQQGVTHGFEVATGKRIDGQSLKGEYSTVATRSVKVAAKTAWKEMWKPEGLALWLGPMSAFSPKKGEAYEVEGGVFGEVRTVKPLSRVRMTWQEDDWSKPSIVQLLVLARGKEKCMLVVSHGELKSAALREQMRTIWKKNLDGMRNFLESRRKTSG